MLIFQQSWFELQASDACPMSALCACVFTPPHNLPQALGFLNYLMLGTAASPLRKALNDSGLGESIIGGGIEDELRQPVFSLGLKVGAEC